MADKYTPAFPRPGSNDAIPLEHTQYGDNIQFDDPQSGMTLRDYFAAKAMQGILAFNGDIRREPSVKLSKFCYEIADKMMEERK